MATAQGAGMAEAGAGAQGAGGAAAQAAKAAERDTGAEGSKSARRNAGREGSEGSKGVLGSAGAEGSKGAGAEGREGGERHAGGGVGAAATPSPHGATFTCHVSPQTPILSPQPPSPAAERLEKLQRQLEKLQGLDTAELPAAVVASIQSSSSQIQTEIDGLLQRQRLVAEARRLLPDELGQARQLQGVAAYLLSLLQERRR